jgi:hypothetical protein
VQIYSPQAIEVAMLYKVEISLEICQGVCVSLALSNMDSQSGILTFRNSLAAMDFAPFSKVLSNIVLRSDTVHLTSEVVVFFFIEKNVISHSSPCFIWEIENTEFSLNIPGYDINNLPSGEF